MTARQTAEPELRPPVPLSQLLPPATLLSPAPSAAASPAPPGCVTPPLSEPDQRAETAASGGTLKFFGKDGHVLLELSHAPVSYERRTSWMGVSRKTYWPAVTVAAPVDDIAGRCCSARLGESSPQRTLRRRRKQAAPLRRQALHMPLLQTGCLPAGRTQLRRLGRRPTADPAAAGRLGSGAARRRRGVEPVLSAEARSACLMSVVRRLWDRHPRTQPPAPAAACARTEKGPSRDGAVRPLSPRKRPLSAREMRVSPRPRPSPAEAPPVSELQSAAAAPTASARRVSSVHSIDSLLSRTTAPARPPESTRTPPVVPASPIRPAEPPLTAGFWPLGYGSPYSPYALYGPYTGVGGLAPYLRAGEWLGDASVAGASLVPQPAGSSVGLRRGRVRRPTPLLPAQLAASQPSPAHRTPVHRPAHRAAPAGPAEGADSWRYSAQNDTPLNLSKR